MPGQKKDANYENWLECGICGWLCPIYQVEKEATIKDQMETIESPFESAKFHLETVKKRTSKIISKRSRRKIKLDDDPEINDILRIFGDRVKVLK
jgi:Na+-translocating ferredoxin:NAD+ oxidoreductase RnfC subunit